MAGPKTVHASTQHLTHSLRALSARTRAWQDEVSRMAKEHGLDVLRIGVDDQQTAIAMSEFIAERRLRKV